MKKRCYRLSVSLIAGICLVSSLGIGEEAVANKKAVSISDSELKTGQRAAISTKIKNPIFKSSNSRIASVSKDGIVTGKKPGKVKITVSGKGSKARKLIVKVAKSYSRPSLPVAMDEIITKTEMRQDAQGEYQYAMQVKNTAKDGKIKKIEYIYQIQTKTEATIAQAVSPASVSVTSSAIQDKTVSIIAKNIKPGKTSKWISCQGDYSGSTEKMKLKTIKLYTGKALYIYNASSKKYVLNWGVPDTKAPKFGGWVKKNSYCNGETYLICYSDRKNQYNFKKYITVKDDRDSKVSVKVDTKDVNWEKDGFYKVHYTAKDKAGNVSRSWTKIQVIVPGTAESVADSVLKSITNKGWSDERKARAIYDYTRNHCSYVDADSHSDWRNSGLSGIRYAAGDCFTYYAVCRLLLSRAGIPNLTVERYPAYANGNHWWSLVHLDSGWYHFDTTPRLAGGRFCLNTDAQLRAYSTGSTFRYQTSKYPKRAVKVISPTPRRDKSQR